MKNVLFITGLLLIGVLHINGASAQSTFNAASVGHAAKAFSQQRLEAQRSAMWILGAWAGVSIASGIGLALQNNTVPLRYAGYQNIGWGAVNAALAGVALVGIANQLAALDAMSAGKESMFLLKELGEEQTFSKVLLINVGLDVGYMLVGSALMYGGRNGLNRGDEFFGSGLGVLVQGAFLLAFDIWQVVLSSRRVEAVEQTLYPLVSLLPAAPMSQLGLTMRVSF